VKYALAGTRAYEGPVLLALARGFERYVNHELTRAIGARAKLPVILTRLKVNC
jgi:hypothetical protein